MTIVQLQYLLALDNYGSFAEAAKQSFVTQPTLSMQIQKLEDEIGLVLFDRSRQPVKPTEMGKKIIEQARVVIREHHQIYEIVADESNELEGTFRLGIIPTVSPYLLPLFLKQFTNKYEKISLIIEEVETSEIITKLKRDELDAAILVTPLHEKEIIEKSLYFEQFLAYVSPDHHLSKNKKISVAELELDEVWLLKEGHCFRDQVINICKGLLDKNEKHKLVFEASSFDTLIKLVEKNFGITLLPYLAVKEMVAKRRAKYVREFIEPIPKREVSLVYHRKHLRKKVIDALEKSIMNSLPPEVKKEKSGYLVEIH